MTRRRGFTLTEVLMTLSLIATASLVAGRLFVASMRTMETSRQSANAQASADHCDVLLRQDVWTAQRIEQLNARQLMLANAKEDSIRWTIEQDVLSRSQGPSVQRWPADGLHFAADPAGVSLVDGWGTVLRTFLLPLQAIGNPP